MVSTRNKSYIMAPCQRSPTEELVTKITNSKMSTETKEIFKLFVSMFSTLQLERDNRISSLDQKVNELDSRNQVLEQKIETIQSHTVSEISKLNDKVISLEDQLNFLRSMYNKEVELMKTSIDSNNQYERLDTLIISGPELPIACDTENSKLIIQDLLRRECNFNLAVNDISTAHRIGRKPAGGEDRRNLIFKLCRRDLVYDIFNSCKQSKPKFFINCSLTPNRNKIMFALRQLKKKFPNIVRKCASFNGDVAVFVAPPDSYNSTGSSSSSNPRDRKFVLNTRQDLDKFATDFLHTSIDELNINW